MKKSNALKLLEHVWQHSCECAPHSWDRVNHSMRNALSLAIGSGMSFNASDFNVFIERFRCAYWMTNSPEWVYSHAIIVGNASCVEAFEKWSKREPFRGNNVSVYRIEGGGYIHANSIARQRDRLAVGFGLPLLGKQWWVTAFNDNDGTIRLAHYAHYYPQGKPKNLMKLTHEELAKLCPAPKKKKPPTPAEEAMQPLAEEGLPE